MASTDDGVLAQAAGIRLQRVTDSEELAAVAHAWNRLACEHPDPLPFNSYAWFSAYAEHRLGPGQSWACLFAWCGEELVGALPLTLKRVRRLGMAGTVVSLPHDAHTQFCSLLVRPGRERDVVPALIAGALSLASDCLVLELPALRGGSAAIGEALESGGRWRALRSTVGMAAYLPVGDDYDAYRASRSRKHRSNLSRATKRLAEHEGAAFVFRRDAATLDADLDEFMAAEAASWKGEVNTAIRASDSLVRFYTTLVERLAEAGWLSWQTLRADGGVMASSLAVDMGSRTVLVKIGVDAAYREVSPGVLLVEEIVRRAHADGTRELDFLTDQPWFRPWGVELRPVAAFDLYPAAVRAQLFGYLPHRFVNAVRGIAWLTAVGRRVRPLLRRISG